MLTPVISTKTEAVGAPFKPAESLAVIIKSKLLDLNWLFERFAEILGLLLSIAMRIVSVVA